METFHGTRVWTRMSFSYTTWNEQKENFRKLLNLLTRIHKILKDKDTLVIISTCI